MATGPAFDIATYFDGLVTPSLTLGTDLFYSKSPDVVPADSPIVVVLDSGGFDPEANKERTHFQPTIQIIIAGSPGKYDVGRLIADQIQTAITNAGFVYVSPDGFTYYGSFQMGDINWLGYNENNRPKWSMNFRLYRRVDN
jgi:hypothetical protein